MAKNILRLPSSAETVEPLLRLLVYPLFPFAPAIVDISGPE